MTSNNRPMPTKFDVIIVGAGPAGATSAYILSKMGFRVLLVDRGRGAGSKEVYGGRIYAGPLREIWPKLSRDAPIHRWIKKERFSLLSKDNKVVTFEYNTNNPLSFTTYLPELTKWMISKAEEEGTIFIDEVVIDRLLISNGKIIGIGSGPDEIKSEVVIDAEGVNRLLLERIGLAEKPRPEALALGIKEVLRTGKNEINSKFNIDDNEGVAWILMGSITKGIPGGGFIYTFNDTISIGIVIHLANAIKAAENNIIKHSYELIENLRLQPYLNKFWENSDVIEYAAHLTIEDGLSFMPRKLVTSGLLIVGDAAGLLLNTGYTIRGVDFAVYSGKLAAEAIEKAFNDKKGTSENNLKIYEDMLEKSFILKELRKHRATKVFMNDPSLFNRIYKIPSRTLSKLYEIDGEVPTIYDALKESSKETGLGFLSLLFKLWKVVRRL